MFELVFLLSESTRAIANVFVRAKTKRLTAWTCRAYVKRAKKLFVPNPIANIVVMIVLIIIRTPWNVLVLLTLRNANMLSLT